MFVLVVFWLAQFQCDLHGVGTARSPMFSRIKHVPATMWGTLFARRVRPALAVAILGSHGFLHCKGDFQDSGEVKTVEKRRSVENPEKSRSEERREVKTAER